jgi:4-amino-4-deoxy-L-arabinose transferase-like glycosyltransferase
MKRAHIHIILLLLLTLFTFVVNNGAMEANIMEARNLTTAREMLEKGNWFEPTMNGELRFEKPPLPTWAAALSMMAFGQDNLSLLRLPSAFAAILLIFFLFKLTEELTKDEKLPLLVAGTAATSFYIFFMARDISWDIFCHSFMIGAIWQLHRGLNKPDHKLKNFIFAGLLMSLSFLSKGPVSFFALLLPYILARIISNGIKVNKNNIKPLFILILIVLGLSAIWPVYVYSSHPDFSAYVAQKESEAWLNRSVKPFYHYWSFPLQSGIWAILSIVVLVFPYARKRIEQFGDYKFLVTWVVAAVILLSMFPEKKERYLLPVLLPLAMLTAFFVRYLIKAFKDSTATISDTIILRINGWLIAVLSFIVPVAIWWMIRKNGISPNLMVTITGILVFWTIAFVLARSAYQKKPFLLWIGMVALIASACLFGIGQAPKIITKNQHFRPYYELRHQPELNNLPFYRNGEVGAKFLEVVWASGREIKFWDPQKQQNLPVEPPIVFMSSENPFSVLGEEIQEKYEIEELGLFDANLQERWGGDVLKNYVTIIKREK